MKKAEHNNDSLIFSSRIKHIGSNRDLVHGLHDAHCDVASPAQFGFRVHPNLKEWRAVQRRGSVAVVFPSLSLVVVDDYWPAAKTVYQQDVPPKRDAQLNAKKTAMLPLPTASRCSMTMA